MSNPTRRRSAPRFDEHMRISTVNLEKQYKERDESLQKKKTEHLDRLEERIRSTQNLTASPRKPAVGVPITSTSSYASAVKSTSSSNPSSSTSTARSSSGSSTSSSRTTTTSSRTAPSSARTTTSKPTTSTTTASTRTTSTTSTTTTSRTASSLTSSSASSRVSAKATSRTSSLTNRSTSPSTITITRGAPVYKEVTVVRSPSRAAQELNKRTVATSVLSPRAGAAAPSPRSGSGGSSGPGSPATTPREDGKFSTMSFADIEPPSSPVKRAPAKSSASPTKGKATAAKATATATPTELVADGKLNFFLAGLHIKSALIEMKGSLLAHAAEEQVYVWDLASEQAVTIFCEHTTDVTSVSMFTLETTGSTLIVSSSSAETLVWDALTGEVVKSLPGAVHTSVFYHAYSAPTTTASTATTGARRKTSASPVPALPQPPKVHVLLTHDHNIEVWDLEKAECVQILKGHKARVNVVNIMHTSQTSAPKGATAAVAAAAKKALVISASADGSVRVWNLANGECEQTLWHCSQNDAAGVDAMCVAEGGRFAVTVSADDRTLKVWDLHPPYKCVFSQSLSKRSPQLVSLTLEDARLESKHEGKSLSVQQIAKETRDIFKFGVDENANMVLMDKAAITIGSADGAPFFSYKK